MLGLNGAVLRSEKPTISCVPARGEDFQKGLLAPIDMESLQLLARTGWSWERILRTTVQYMNEVDNATSAGGPTPDIKPNFEEFRYLAKMLRQLQIHRGVELATAEKEGSQRKRVPRPRDQLDGDFVINSIKEGFNFEETDEGLFLVKDEQYLALIVHPQAKCSREMQEVARLLNLHIDFNSPKPGVYEVNSAKEGWIQPAYANSRVYPNVLGQGRADMLSSPSDAINLPKQREDIVISTRSLLEVLFY